MAVVALSSLSRILGECLTIHSMPVVCFFKVEIAHTLISTLYATISPQRLIELR